MGFTNQACVIAVMGQHVDKCGRFQIKRDTVVDAAMVGCHLARHQTGPVWHANRIGYIGAVKSRAAGG